MRTIATLDLARRALEAAALAEARELLDLLDGERLDPINAAAMQAARLYLEVGRPDEAALAITSALEAQGVELAP